MSGWTQPVCDRCWAALYPSRIPTKRVITDERVREVCAICLAPTRAGLYIRRDPALDIRNEAEKDGQTSVWFVVPPTD